MQSLAQNCAHISRVNIREKYCTGLLLLANILYVFQSTGVENQQYNQYHHYPPPPGSPVQLTPVLLNSQVDRLADAAYELVCSLPPLEPKNQQLNNKRKMSKELEVGAARPPRL